MLFAYVTFFLVALWLGICVEVATVEEISRIRILSEPSSLPSWTEVVFPSLPRIPCLTQVTVT